MSDDTGGVGPPAPGRRLIDSLVGVTLERIGRLADALDRADQTPGRGEGEVTGAATTALAVAKAAGVLATSPLSVPTLAVAARRTALDSLTRIDRFADHLQAIVAGAETPLPAPRTSRVDGRRRWLITSDLHRCVAGGIDWPQRQGTKELYALMLEHYAQRGWGLIENGDAEDFWLVGGSTWGAVYDIARVAGRVVAPFEHSIEWEVLGQHLDRIVANNARSYETIRDGFLAEGRYHRTVGNHDEVLAQAPMIARLEEHQPGVSAVDTVLLVDPGVDRAADEVRQLCDVMAVVTHGHLTDSWNGPGYSPLGRAITWLALGLDDLPSPGGSRNPDSGEAGSARSDSRRGASLPDEQAVDRLLGGRGRNRLISLEGRFGGNRRFDSLDEERLFAALLRDSPEDGWPWLMFGHTHYPMLRPLNRSGHADAVRELRLRRSRRGGVGDRMGPRCPRGSRPRALETRGRRVGAARAGARRDTAVGAKLSPDTAEHGR